MTKDLSTILSKPPDTNRKKQVCIVQEAISTNEQGDAIKAAVDNPKWSAAGLARVLGDFHVTISASSISNHRRGNCACRGQGN